LFDWKVAEYMIDSKSMIDGSAMRRAEMFWSNVHGFEESSTRNNMLGMLVKSFSVDFKS